MSYFAKVIDNKVVKVIAAEQDFIDQYDDGLGGEWIQTSFNSRGGKHYDRNGVEDDKPHLRYNNAGGDFKRILELSISYNDSKYYDSTAKPLIIVDEKHQEWWKKYINNRKIGVVNYGINSS